MIYSMTGYGRGQQTMPERDILVEIKSVNHRFFEFSARLPRAYGFLEEKLKSYVQSRVSRGKVDVSVFIVNLDGANVEVGINTELAKGYINALRKLGEETGIGDDITLTSISRFSDIFIVRRAEEDEDELWQQVKQVTEEAVSNFLAMRAREGEKMKKDLLERLESIEKSVAVVEQSSERIVEDYRTRLYKKISDVLADKHVDEQRILTEAAIFAEKTAVDEETVRLRSHIAQFRQILEANEPIGRKLDFLVQEMNREANTTGSKIQDIEVTRVVVSIKSDIEKIREQIQNIE
ncbi:MAG: YicC family protein [Oscillospiraceae bacterium]|nr:YicC family protein [Oscillospiraceae bacterium]